MGDSHVGQLARLMSQALRKLTGALAKTDCAAIFINQLREKVGVAYGNPEVTPWRPRAQVLLERCASRCARVEPLKQTAARLVGNRARVKVVKNKVAPAL